MLSTKSLINDINLPWGVSDLNSYWHK